MDRCERPGWSGSPLLPDDVCILPVLAFALFPLPVHHRGVHVSRGEGVRFVEEGDDAQEDGPGEGSTKSAGTGCGWCSRDASWKPGPTL